MRFHIRCFIIIVLIIAGNVFVAVAQDTVLNVKLQGKLDSLQSLVLNQKRFIQVFMPAGYKPRSNSKYDVLYVLDGGNWNTGLVSQLQSFVQSESFMPQTIIVSVMGIDRNVELTPTYLDKWKGSGGGIRFLSFIKNELIPYIDKNYPSNGDNTLWGHSLSGMFAIYALVNEPGLFKSVIAVDPSIWWDNSMVAKMAADKLTKYSSQNTSLFIAGRQDALGEMKTDTMELVLKQSASKNLNWKVQAYSGETHASVRLKGTYDGLKFAYDGLTSKTDFFPMNGIVLKNKPYPVWFFGDTTKLHYTLDGTDPTIVSPKVTHQLMVNGPSNVTYKSFSNRSRYDQVTKGTFTTEKLPKPIAKPADFQPGGFNYSYYEITGDSSVNLKLLKPVQTGITDKNFEISKLPRKNNFALIIDGMLEAKEDGYYIFAFTADKGSKLYIDGKLMITWNGNYNRRNYSCIIPLSKGFYPLRLEYYHTNPDFNLRWSYSTPSTIASKNPVPIPVALQYGRR